MCPANMISRCLEAQLNISNNGEITSSKISYENFIYNNRNNANSDCTYLSLSVGVHPVYYPFKKGQYIAVIGLNHSLGGVYNNTSMGSVNSTTQYEALIQKDITAEYGVASLGGSKYHTLFEGYFDGLVLSSDVRFDVFNDGALGTTRFETTTTREGSEDYLNELYIFTEDTEISPVYYELEVDLDTFDGNRYLKNILLYYTNVCPSVVNAEGNTVYSMAELATGIDAFKNGQGDLFVKSLIKEGNTNKYTMNILIGYSYSNAVSKRPFSDTIRENNADVDELTSHLVSSIDEYTRLTSTGICAGHMGCCGHYDFSIIVQQPSIEDIFKTLDLGYVFDISTLPIDSDSKDIYRFNLLDPVSLAEYQAHRQNYMKYCDIEEILKFYNLSMQDSFAAFGVSPDIAELLSNTQLDIVEKDGHYVIEGHNSVTNEEHIALEDIIN